MSFGDPNNPYDQQQGGQPGFGQPQSGPNYGYPQAPPVQPYGGGYPGAPMSMPGGVKAARVMLFVIAGLQLIGAVLIFIAGAAVDAAKDDPSLQDDVNFEQLADFPTAALYVMAVVALGWGVFGLVLGTKFGKGGNGLRVTTMVFGILTAIAAVYPFFPIGIPHLVLAILIAVFVGKSDGAAWFQRPRH